MVNTPFESHHLIETAPDAYRLRLIADCDSMEVHMRLLHIDSSVLGDNSASRSLSAAIVARLRREHPGLEITRRDLAAQTQPHFTPVLPEGHPCAARNAEILDEFLAADIVVIGAPMYNFTIPTQLKAWFDRILTAGKTFRYTANGPEGLAGGKRVIVASSRGGIYSEGPAAAIDFQEPYLRQVLGFIGIDNPEFVRAEGLNLGARQREAAMAKAHAQITGDARIAA
jgi:FMN-dependent NADH-azoreductase